MLIRPAVQADHGAIWHILEPVIRAGETYTLAPEMSEAAALAYWTAPGHETFVAERNGDILGTYYLRANQQGGGAHVANCGYMTAQNATGQGIARAMAEHSFAHARARNYRAMQFNFVVSTNTRAVKLWEAFGFQTLCRLPGAFRHPIQGYVDALVMFRQLA
ncbi:MAG: GNAT family N-acetyltransferase [Acidocella sp. 20-63-7]|nr:MAG: GNAT family N-acetyltransferase [Acidocella sp. 20-63-7]HQT47114.1 GNAT family N-acetyltransferase [Acidocella sp.]